MRSSRLLGFAAVVLLLAATASPLIAAGKPDPANPPLTVAAPSAKAQPPSEEPPGPGKGLSGPKFGPLGVPANDLCTNAQAVAIPSATAGTTVDATFDNVGTCGTANTAPGVWYTFTPATGGSFRASVCNAANYDSKISVFGGSCGLLGCRAGNDDASGCGLTSQVDFAAPGGEPVYVLVHGFSTAVGSFTLSLSQLGAGLANDTCGAAVPVAIPSTSSGTTTGASVDLFVPQCGTNATAAPTAPGVWYEVTGTGNVLQASTCNQAAYDTQLTVLCQDCATPTCINGNDDVIGTCAGFTSQVQWESELGATYRILVHGFGAASGAFDLTVTDTGTPSVDPVPCFGALGACCDPSSGGCTQTDVYLCTLAGGTFAEGFPCVSTDQTTSIGSNPALAIPDNDPAGVTDTITVPDSDLLVANVFVDIGITHTFIGDLTITLENVDSGGTVNMWDFRCGSQDNINTTFIDGGTTSLCTVIGAGGGQVDPTLSGDGPPFSSFIGLPSDGDWRLHVADEFGLDTGTLNTWTLHVAEGAAVCYAYPVPQEIPTLGAKGIATLAVLLAGAAAFLLWRRRG